MAHRGQASGTAALRRHRHRKDHDGQGDSPSHKRIQDRRGMAVRTGDEGHDGAAARKAGHRGSQRISELLPGRQASHRRPRHGAGIGEELRQRELPNRGAALQEIRPTPDDHSHHKPGRPGHRRHVRREGGRQVPRHV